MNNKSKIPLFQWPAYAWSIMAVIGSEFAPDKTVGIAIIAFGIYCALFSAAIFAWEKQKEKREKETKRIMSLPPSQWPMMSPKMLYALVEQCSINGIAIYQRDVIHYLFDVVGKKVIAHGSYGVDYGRYKIPVTAEKPEWKIWKPCRRVYRLQFALPSEIDLRAHELGYNEDLTIPEYEMIELC